MFLAIALLFFVIWSPVFHTVMIVVSAPTQQQPDPEEFWISVDLLNVEWKPSCFIISYCNKPELKMIKANPLSNSVFISHWTTGSHVDIEMSIEIIGIDPKYRFQRSCDQTVATKAFKYEVQEEHSGSSSVGNGSDLGQLIVELRGRCFNATLTVQKYIRQCPWWIKAETTTAATAEPYENEFPPIEQCTFVVFTCIVTSCLVIMCAIQYILKLYEKSGKLAKRKATILPVVQSRSWKIVKIDGNSHLTSDTMNDNKSSTSRSTLKSESLINCAGGQIFANSDTIIESDRSSSINDRTYDNVAHSDDV
uniref:Fibronectin type-III domain-containing protein n=1 Tax=Loa loa TaxID=7209 RepID=A0A1I7VJZ1_LOALO